MSQMRDMLNAHPNKGQVDVDAFAKCIAAAMECAQICTTCADACLSEENVANLATCIRLDLECAEICETTARGLSRLSQPNWAWLRRLVSVCGAACKVCAQECDKHAKMHQHCKLCAESCRRCESECHRVLEAIPAGA